VVLQGYKRALYPADASGMLPTALAWGLPGDGALRSYDMNATRPQGISD
jgi:hypothetical protein